MPGTSGTVYYYPYHRHRHDFIFIFSMVKRMRKGYMKKRRGGYKKFKRSRLFRRRSNYSRIRHRPEVKYVATMMQDQTNIPGAYNSTASANLTSSYYGKATYFPAQGTTDVTRIGDTIHPIKCWIYTTFWNNPTYSSIIVRIIIFSMNYDPSGATISAFWQSAIKNPCITGVVNREVVRKVYFDKQYTIRANISSQAVLRKTVNINIRMKKPIVFAGGQTTPKDPANNLFIAYIPEELETNATATLMRVTTASNFYYVDN